MDHFGGIGAEAEHLIQTGFAAKAAQAGSDRDRWLVMWEKLTLVAALSTAVQSSAGTIAHL